MSSWLCYPRAYISVFGRRVEGGKAEHKSSGGGLLRAPQNWI